MSEIEGAVVWPDATPCAGVIVAVAGSDARWYGPGSGRVEGPGWAMVRADGTFRVRGVAAGAPVRLEVGRHRTGRINVPTGWTEPILPGTRELRITVTPGRALIGRVVSPDCRPLQRVGVMVWSGAEDDRSTLQCDTTDADGRFVIDALWPPPWHVEAYAFPGDVSGDPTVGGPEVRVLYPGTYDDAAPVELVLDVPIVRRPRNAGDAAQVKP